jgi:hypothetical protein
LLCWALWQLLLHSSYAAFVVIAVLPLLALRLATLAQVVALTNRFD